MDAWILVPAVAGLQDCTLGGFTGKVLIFGLVFIVVFIVGYKVGHKYGKKAFKDEITRHVLGGIDRRS